MINKFLITALIALGWLTAYAQQPKMNLKVFGGYHSHIFVYQAETKSKDVFHGWQGGFGFRVSYRRIFGEIDFAFVRSGAYVPDPEGSIVDEPVELKINAFEVPIKAGFIPVKEALFKWYLYSGINVRSNTKGILVIGEDEFDFKPKEIGLSNPNLDFLLGTQFDVGWVNFEVLYSLGVTDSLRENIRTNSHEIHFNIGLIF